MKEVLKCISKLYKFIIIVELEIAVISSKLNLNMRDFTSNKYCDFLWINELLNLKRNKKNAFTTTLQKGKLSTKITIEKVIIFGTIVEIKQLRPGGVLYFVDDGTGVIACKHSESQFEEIINVIENEHHDILNQTLISREWQSSVGESSMEDSIFNDKSIQNDESEANKKSQLMGLQSMWDDIYESFSNLIKPYKLGDVVLIQGKLYNYFHVNQIYVNIIRPMELSEEILKLSVKLEDTQNMFPKTTKESRLSGLMTFDHIHHLNARFPSSRDIKTPTRSRTKVNQEETKVVSPYLESTLTFDTLDGNR